jgi:hypothetical protein
VTFDCDDPEEVAIEPPDSSALALLLIGQGDQTFVVMADPEGNEFWALRAR